MTDESGAVRTTYAYDLFGNTTISGEASDNPFQYTGRENDGTGLYYYRARYYSPELQRFISEDPIRFESGDVNFYAYVRNNPVNKIDPYGLKETCVWFGVSGTATIAIGVQIIKQVGYCWDECGNKRWLNRNCLCSCVGILLGGCIEGNIGNSSTDIEGWSAGLKWLCLSGSGSGLSGGGGGAGLRFGFAYCWCVCDISGI